VESGKLYTGVMGEGDEAMLSLDDLEDDDLEDDDLEDDESNRRSGGVLCDEAEDSLFE
jgi:hypothetical protein